MKSKQQTEITTLSEVLRYLREEDYEDNDDYAPRLASLFVESLVVGDDKAAFLNKASRIHTNFFKVNRIRKLDFLQTLHGRLLNRGIRPPEEDTLPPLSIDDIFPKMRSIKDGQIIDLDKKLDIDEAAIQNALRSAFRDDGAFPIARRGKDSALEVADIEHFYAMINGKKRSFTVVVKGLSSLHGKKRRVNWEDISHQVTKAYNTRPDYVIVATAMDPVDRLITEMRLYAESVGKPNLIVFVPPMDLARFLLWKGTIKT
jgi:hypothetical protein